VSGSELLPAFRLPSSVALNTWINDSLAICEYLAEQYPEYSLWPKDGYLRALARSAAARMHSGFPALRSAYHTNFTAKYTGAVPVSEAARKEVEKALALWADSRKRTVARLKELGEKDEGFLFGSFGIADSFFWPVLWVRIIYLHFRSRCLAIAWSDSFFLSGFGHTACRWIPLSQRPLLG
jgi:glutathione S-transferase